MNLQTVIAKASWIGLTLKDTGQGSFTSISSLDMTLWIKPDSLIDNELWQMADGGALWKDWELRVYPEQSRVVWSYDDNVTGIKFSVDFIPDRVMASVKRYNAKNDRGNLDGCIIGFGDTIEYDQQMLYKDI